jgi:PAS domain S-box-containing protein
MKKVNATKLNDPNLIKPPNRAIIVFLAITMSLVVFGAWNAWTIYSGTIKAWGESSDIQRISREIVHLDEVLTMSARMGAATGDSFWEKRYKQNEPKLRKLIGQIKEINPKFVISRFIKKTENANNKLVNIERQAFLKIHEGKSHEAKAILFGKEYENQKLIYSMEMEMLIKKVRSINHIEISKNDRRLLIFSFICIFLLLISWFAGWLAFARYFVQRRKSEVLAMRFGRILDHSFNEIFIINAETLRFEQISLGARKNLGYSEKEFFQLTALDIKPELTIETIGKLVEPLWTEQKPLIIFETMHRRKDGTLYPVEVRLQLMKNESPPVFVAIIDDISERKTKNERC